MKVAKKLLALLFWFGVWYGIAFLWNQPLLLPYPHTVILEIVSLLFKGSTYYILANSFVSIIIGILTGTILSVLLVVLCHAVPTVHDFLTPVLSVMKTTPVASFIILAFLFIGGDKIPALVSFLMTLPICYFSLWEGLLNVDKKLWEVTELYHFTAQKKLKYLYLPSLKPSIFSALKASIGMSWKAGIAAEIIARSKDTIGFQISEGKLYLEVVSVFAWTGLVILISFALEKLCIRLLSGGKQYEN